MVIQKIKKAVGQIKVPGDKSISHRAVMLGSLANGVTEISGFLKGADCLSTIDCFRKMGIDIDINGENVTVHGNGLRGLKKPDEMLYTGNSGTTTRLLCGILAGQNFDTSITGDASIQKRPMGRVVQPLSMMGAKIENEYCPLYITGTKLHGIDYKMPVASAQVKTAIILAGLYADGETVIHEIEKIISELKIAVKAEGTSRKIKTLAAHLSRVVDSYAELLRNKSKATNSLVDIIKQALFSVEYRLNAHEIEIIDEFSEYKGNVDVKCASNMIVGAIINIIDNSIYWTTYAKKPERKILFKITEEIEGVIGIVIADNGIGFKISGEDAIKPFVTTKTNGLGLGLNIVSEIMIAQNGTIVFPENGDIDLPQELQDGAVVMLAFSKE